MANDCKLGNKASGTAVRIEKRNICLQHVKNASRITFIDLDNITLAIKNGYKAVSGSLTLLDNRSQENYYDQKGNVVYTEISPKTSPTPKT
jgi:hypothetical protein